MNANRPIVSCAGATSQPMRVYAARLFLAIVLAAICGCATYTDSIREAQHDIRAGEPERAIALINEKLDTEDARELPPDLEDDRTLLLLERATLLQAMGEYELAARDMMIADQRLEWLDIGSSKGVELAKYLYSEASGKYRAPVYERLLLNTLNMINFLVLRNFQSAKVEARRFTLLEGFFIDDQGRAVLPHLLALGNYLGGVAFEGSRELDLAARYYSRAWHFGFRTDDLRERLVDLHRVTGYSAHELDPRASGLDAIRSAAASKGPLSAAEYRRKHVDGQAVIIVQSGLVPYKRPERVPIGMALSYSSRHHHPHHLSAHERAQAQQLALHGALKFVNFPVLTREGIPTERASVLFVDGVRERFALTTDVADEVERAWDRIAGALMATAITRMITRAVAGQTARAGTHALARSGDATASTAGALGWLAALAVEGTMTAADRPDTRSWTTLPASVRIARLELDPGVHRVAAMVGNRTEERIVKIGAQGLTVVNFSRYR